MTLRSISGFPLRLVGGLLIAAVRLYQLTLSPVLGGLGIGCRYFPSCSEYMIQAIRKHGPLLGVAKGIARLCRCHPWAEGGYDPP